MKAVDYLKEKARMTNNCDTCRNCPLDIEKNEKDLTCVKLEGNDPEKAVEIVAKWAKENPVKTYKDVLMEKFPKVILVQEQSRPSFCVEFLLGRTKCDGSMSCVDCWNREYKDSKNGN